MVKAHRKFEDGYILLNGAAADACDQLALAGERRSAAQVCLLDDGRRSWLKEYCNAKELAKRLVIDLLVALRVDRPVWRL
jgi:hypothetical protein